MDNITVNMNNLTETEKEQLLTLVEKANKDKPKKYIPESGEKYWYIAYYGQVDGFEYWYNAPTDKDSLKIGNCFKTCEEAEFELEKLKVIKELKDYALEHNEYEIDWKDRDKNKNKWYIYYNYYYSDINYDAAYSIKLNTVYFTSSQIADNAIKTIGKNRLKKYYFGIEE